MIYPEKLEKNEAEYYFENEKVFMHPLDFIHGFWIRDTVVKMHTQDFTEINIITGGMGMHYIGEKRIEARKGDIFIIPPHANHGYMGEEDFEVYNVIINNYFMDKYMGDLQQLPAFSILFKAEPLFRMRRCVPLHLCLTEKQFIQIERCINEIQQYSAPDTWTKNIMCCSLVIILITKLCEFYVENHEKEDTVGRIESPSVSLKEIQEDKAFLDTLTLIHEHYDEKISIERMADTAHLSRSALFQRFQEICGMPPLQYLNQRRLEVAKYLLLSTNLSVLEVAERTGFYDASHFSRSFFAAIGMSPAEYRKINGVR